MKGGEIMSPKKTTKPRAKSLLVETTYYRTTAAGRKGKKIKTDKSRISTSTLTSGTR